MTIIDFIEKHWELILGGGATVAYLTEKIISYISDRKRKKQAYNRLFTGLIKLYHSYLKNKQVFAEKQVFDLPDEIWATVAKHLDNFQDDLKEFKDCVNRETKIIPEISINFHFLFDAVGRLTVIDKIKIIETSLSMPTDQVKLIIKRAQFYALQEKLDDYFNDLIDETCKKTTVTKEFVKRLKELNTDKELREMAIEQEKIMYRYLESLYRQGALPENVYNQLTRKKK